MASKKFEIYLGVVLRVEHNFWSSIESSHYIFSHGSDVNIHFSGKSKITNFNITIFISQNIGWLDISMNNLPCMNIFERPEDLVHNELHMIIRELFPILLDELI